MVATPKGVRTRTRLLPDEVASLALAEIGTHLGGLYRRTLARRLNLGRVHAQERNEWRACDKRELTAESSSRWAGAMTRQAQDQYQLGMRALSTEVRMLQQATSTIEGRLAVGAKKPYRSGSERKGKRRRLAQLRERLTASQARLERARPSLAVGSGRLWSMKANLEAAGLSEAQWRERWDASRMFFTADGESGRNCGNETITADGESVRIKVPAALAARLGKYVHVPMVSFAHRGDEWQDRAHKRQSVRYDITYDVDKNRWYMDASWSYPEIPEVPLSALRAGKVVGVDLNADHLAAHLLDVGGNPTGRPVTIPLAGSGLPASTRDARLREAISQLLHFADAVDAQAIAIENLSFEDSRNTGRETMGRGGRGKQFRRTVAGIPTAKFRDRLAGMAATAGVHIIAVDPAYTSKWGNQHWRAPLKTSDPDATRHHAAAVAIGRRGLGHQIRRRRTGPTQRQRTLRGTPTASHGKSGQTALPSKAPSGRSVALSRTGPKTRPRRGAPKTVRGAANQSARTDSC